MMITRRCKHASLRPCAALRRAPRSSQEDTGAAPPTRTYYLLVAIGNITDFGTNQDPALQNVVIAGLALIIAHLPSRDWDIPG
jgi:hypothetical protein